jgi:hypothetical protein
MKKLRSWFSWTHLMGPVAALVVATSVANAATLTDDFSDPWPYDAVGDVVGYDPLATSGTGIWQGIHNVANLGGGRMSANIEAEAPEALIVDDNNTVGVGWEGGRSSAPMLYTPVAGNQDFTATIKVSTQTSGFWSAAGLVARAANSPTPPGTGTDNADENFVTMTTFRTDAALPDEGNTLMKRVENGAQLQDNNFPIINPGAEPLPLWIRLEKVNGGSTYRGWASTDGVNYQFQSRVTPSVGNAMADGSTEVQVGIVYQNFGGSAGTTVFDDFHLETYDPLPAPGAPVISAAVTELVANPGDVITSLITNSAPDQGPLSWTRVADPGNPAAPVNPPTISSASALLPGVQGGAPSTLVPAPASLDESYFRWNTAVTMAGAPNVLPPVPWTPGLYKFTVTATNDWGQASNPVDITVRVVPEPVTLSLLMVGFGSLIVVAARRRRA